MLKEAWKNKQIFGEDFNIPDFFVVRSGDKYMFWHEGFVLPPAWFAVGWAACATKFDSPDEAAEAAEAIMKLGFKDVRVEGW